MSCSSSSPAPGVASPAGRRGSFPPQLPTGICPPAAPRPPAQGYPGRAASGGGARCDDRTGCARLRGMRNDIPLTAVGNLVEDPELRFTPNGVPVARFTIASTPRTYEREADAWRDGEPTFLDCTAWRYLAASASRGAPGRHRPPAHRPLGNPRGRKTLENGDGRRRSRRLHDLRHRHDHPHHPQRRPPQGDSPRRPLDHSNPHPPHTTHHPPPTRHRTRPSDPGHAHPGPFIPLRERRAGESAHRPGEPGATGMAHLGSRGGDAFPVRWWCR
ncbi:single-stranded DNA-binding protein [Streptomyces sp. NPDC020799]|uniref:single-stranded DNA-binding protein n=1 Tax=Streptomyces sp. NPDC020799 TaxID=3365091 RepID=UPI0037AD9CEC